MGLFNFPILNRQVRYFVYNENNQIIGEYDLDGNVIAEYVYFGLRPVAVKINGALYAIHTDYLGTTRVVITVVTGGNIVWEWKNDNSYGNNKAIGSIEFNLRFAGQYYDAESGLHYNMNRTYNPDTGRYMQSDLLGLAAGYNTYNYVNKNPLDNVDPLGLIAGTLDPTVIKGDKALGIEAGWLVISMHAGMHMDGSGGFLLDSGSELHEAVKLTPTYRDKLLGKGDFINTTYGKIVQYGVLASTMANMLLESGLVNASTKGIMFEACNSGISTNNGEIMGQIIADITGKIVLAPTAYVYVSNGVIVGSVDSYGALKYTLGFSVEGNVNRSFAAMNVMRRFTKSN